MVLTATHFVAVNAKAQFRPSGRHRHAPAAAAQRVLPTVRPSNGSSPNAAASAPTPRVDASSTRPNDPTLSRLVVRALQLPWNRAIVERIIDASRDEPAALARAIELLEREVSTKSSHAARAALTLHGLYERRADSANCSRLLALLTVEYAHDAEVLEDLADRAFRGGDPTRGQQLMEAALDAQTHPEGKLRVLQRLRNAALDARDLTRAANFHRRLVQLARNSDAQWIEFGSEALARCGYKTAIAVLQPGFAPGQGDHPAYAQLWLDIADAALLADDLESAKSFLARALRGLGTRFANASHLRQTTTEIYRRSEGLKALVQRLEQQAPPSPFVESWIADLYEELGQFSQAIVLRRHAIAKHPNDLELHLALLHSREVAGDLEQAHLERQALVRRFPDCTDQALILADTWRRRGALVQAERTLESLSRKPRLSAEWAHRVADAWERLGQHQRAQTLLSRHGLVSAAGPTVTQSSANNSMPSSRLSAALSTRESTSIAHALRQAEDAIAQGKVPEALTALDRVRVAANATPSTLAIVATLLERAAASATEPSSVLREQAENLWVTLLSQGQLPSAEQPTAIDRVVRLWVLRGTLAEQTTRLQRSYAEKPTDHLLGLWLAEALLRLGDDSAAERVLSPLAVQHPEDDPIAEKLIALYTKRGDFARALHLVEQRTSRLAPSDTVRLGQLVEYAQHAGRPDLAVGYARRWVAMAPSEANAWRQLARLLRRTDSGNRPEAYQALLHASQLSQNQVEILLELADWQTEDGAPEAALSHLLTILRSSNHEGLLLEAARRAMALGVAADRLEQVELALLSATARLPSDWPLREALLEVYSVLIRKAHAVESSTDDGKRLASVELLRRIGPRAGSALLPLLTDRNQAHQKAALDLLSQVRSNGVGRELLAFAGGSGQVELRAQAVLVASNLVDPSLLPDLESLLRNRDQLSQATPVAQAAAFAVSRIRTPKATAVLRTLLRQGGPELNGLSALWLGERGDRASVRDLEALSHDEKAPESSRAAAWLALGRLDPTSASDPAPTPHPNSRILRLAQLARRASLQRSRDADEIAELLLTELDSDLELAVRVAARWVGARAVSWSEVLNQPQSLNQLEQTLLKLSQCEATVDQRFELFSRIADPLGQALQRRILAAPATARSVGRWLLIRAPELSLFPLTPVKSTLSAENQTRLEVLLRTALEPAAAAFGTLIEHPDQETRRLSIGVRVLVQCDEKALLLGLGDRALEVRQSVLRWAPECPSDKVQARIAELLGNDSSFVVRLAAVGSLARLARPRAPRPVIEALSRAARHDGFSAVRMAALSELWRNNPLAAHEELSYAETHDSEPDVVRLARRLRENRP